MSIHVHLLSCIEHEEGSVVEEEVVPQTENPPVENNFTSTSVVWKQKLLQHKASPGAFTPFLVVLKSLSPYVVH
jgi:hypothetical protein